MEENTEAGNRLWVYCRCEEERDDEGLLSVFCFFSVHVGPN